ncbi:Histone acetyltransferase complex subunit, partial [Nowakowskiella sp. JEL0078]
SEDMTLYCICKQVSFGAMVACDCPTCEIEWFHLGCVGFVTPPKGTWFCEKCAQLLNIDPSANGINIFKTNEQDNSADKGRKGRKRITEITTNGFLITPEKKAIFKDNHDAISSLLVGNGI